MEDLLLLVLIILLAGHMAQDMVVLPNVDGVARRHSRDMEVAMVVLLLSRDMVDTAEDTVVRRHSRVTVVLNISSRLPKVRGLCGYRFRNI